MCVFIRRLLYTFYCRHTRPALPFTYKAICVPVNVCPLPAGFHFGFRFTVVALFAAFPLVMIMWSIPGWRADPCPWLLVERGEGEGSCQVY